jgi:hypothetical protein
VFGRARQALELAPLGWGLRARGALATKLRWGPPQRFTLVHEVYKSRRGTLGSDSSSLSHAACTAVRPACTLPATLPPRSQAQRNIGALRFALHTVEAAGEQAGAAEGPLRPLESRLAGANLAQEQRVSELERLRARDNVAAAAALCARCGPRAPRPAPPEPAAAARQHLSRAAAAAAAAAAGLQVVAFLDSQPAAMTSPRCCYCATGLERHAAPAGSAGRPPPWLGVFFGAPGGLMQQQPA